MSTQYITEPATEGKVCLETSLGDVDIELWSKEAPKACRNFVQLCLEGYYDKCKFHTVIKDCIAQTGDPTNTGEGGESIYADDFKVETHQRIKFNRRGLVAMAANEDGFLASQFFITLGSTPELNGKHTLFGKITNNTIFNIFKLNDYAVDSENRPIRSERINKVEVLSNPFKDIVPRSVKNKEKKSKKHKKEKAVIQNKGLLSFGDECNDEELVLFNKKLKGKSAHDVLKDDKLSKDLAVKPEELGGNGNDKGGDDNQESLSRIRERLKKKKRKNDDSDADKEDVDFGDVLDEVQKAEKTAEKEQLEAERKKLQKEYAKSLRGPKVAKAEEDKTTDTIKDYKKMKLKYKTKSDNVVKDLDKQRERQTMKLLDRFVSTVKKETSTTILNNKKVDLSGEKSQEELLREGAETRPKKHFEERMEEDNDLDASTTVKIDENATDEVEPDWMDHAFVAPEDRSGVTKARDANLREEDEDWYDISDPRNKMNQRKREENK
ncbi:unnamed protein product [Bursaphelenchus xylophilus]|uniref:Spliceosome-associated protein CWC27 homolog n=1 Tax=Bursaphelenchus xylophilus TaxID=6326 RepID=A0A1I7SW57_BURXY|nr:unnamed protein product [Bursaphelenchus xylophilus]CAG9098859.1 unnamed protein product [Bursaphelenchus xylophilus]